MGLRWVARASTLARGFDDINLGAGMRGLVRLLGSVAVAGASALVSITWAADSSATTKATDPSTQPAFHTDASPADTKLPWFQLKPGEFPPERSARYIAGELIAVDHINRAGVIRPDRTDAQRRDDWDVPLPFDVLSFGSMWYHGAPAELANIPIGTHLHGHFYTGQATEAPTKILPERRKPVDAAFGKVLLFEDDFTYFSRIGRHWRVDAIALDVGTLTVTGIAADGNADAKPTSLFIGPYVRIWKGNGIGALSDLAAGQKVLINLTVCTLKGPGRCVEIWLDEESRAVARQHQLEKHRRFIREHGVAARVDHVDHREGIVTATFFGGVDPKLLEEFVINETMTAATAEENLRTWDQINDRKGGTVVSMEKVAIEPGSSGLRVRFKPQLLLEGFRPKRIVRLWAAKWKVDDLPREERLYP